MGCSMKRYVIMLDVLMDLIGDGWPITFEDDDLEVVRQQQRFDGNPRMFRPRSDYSLRIIESISLTHVLRPFEDHKGAIYERL